ncbi:MAG TPA: LEA type 2 family protein [Polyangiaceae bacterium]|jgi:LEA14-like dessication related protein|nr:LEA type 2 family protein [Polyangiaceae bacterium]
MSVPFTKPARRSSLFRTSALCARLAQASLFVPSMPALFVATLASASLLACAPQKPTVTPVAARVAAVANTGLTLDVDLDVHNPNSFPLIAQRVEGAILLGNGTELGRGSATPPGSIPSKGSARITTRLQVPWSNLGALAPFLLSAGPVPYVFRGQATIGGDSLNVQIPFELSGALTRDQLLAAGLRGFPAFGG